RHHNPVHSICRKIKSIQMMDQVSNPTLQIPKFSPQNFYNSKYKKPKKVEEIVRRRTFR
ncbi:LRMP protein, partial [Turnix velox]|nr:LRMP protein [Turnix velox]